MNEKEPHKRPYTKYFKPKPKEYAPTISSVLEDTTNLLKDNNEIINYLVNNIEESDLKRYIRYFLSKAEKIEKNKLGYNERYDKLLKASNEGKSICIEFFGKKYYSLGFKGKNDYTLMDNKKREDILEDKIKKLKKIEQMKANMPNLIADGNKYIKDENLLKTFFTNIASIISDYSNIWNQNRYDEIANGLEFLKKINEGKSWEKIKNEIKESNLYDILEFLLIHIEEGNKEILAKCHKMREQKQKERSPGTELTLGDLGLGQNATIDEVAEKLYEKNKKLYSNYRTIFNGVKLEVLYPIDSKDYFIRLYQKEISKEEIMENQIKFLRDIYLGNIDISNF